MRESEKEIIKRVESVAKKRGVSMAQIATAWCLSKDGRPLSNYSKSWLIVSGDCANCWTELGRPHQRHGPGCELGID